MGLRAEGCYCHWFRAICANIIVDRTVAQQLSIEWEYQDHVNKSIVIWLVQASRLPGFSGSLSFGTRKIDDRDPTLNVGVPLPGWASLICPQGLNSAHPVTDPEEEDEILRELNIDTELVVQFVECINTLESAPWYVSA